MRQLYSTTGYEELILIIKKTRQYIPSIQEFNFKEKWKMYFQFNGGTGWRKIVKEKLDNRESVHSFKYPYLSFLTFFSFFVYTNFIEEDSLLYGG